MNKFMEVLEDSLGNVTYTENGARSYKTTKNSLLDFNFKIPSYRRDAYTCIEDFKAVLDDNNPYTLKYLFYLRDARGGLGERNSFRNCFKTFLKEEKPEADKDLYNLIKTIPEYGRWDDVVALFDNEYADIAMAVIKEQFMEDVLKYSNNEPISLLAKWLPSENTSSMETRKKATQLRKFMKLSSRCYRKTLSLLREHLDVVERKCCANEWTEINYNTVPSIANLKYCKAFYKHDEERRAAYLEALKRGDEDVKINSSVNFPHTIVSKYFADYGYHANPYDETLEQLWKNLPEMSGLENTLVIRDGSGSMMCNIDKSGTTALNVADALSIYCADRCKGAFHNKFITFSSRPEFVDISKEVSLHNKLTKLRTFNDCSNTNLKATFNLILNLAVENNLAQDELPKQLLILSDMEFDRGCSYSNTLMQEIDTEFKAAGYNLPKLIFWNVNSRSNAIPMKENEAGVVLVSGFSVSIINMVNNGETDPYKALIKELETDRYKAIPYFKK